MRVALEPVAYAHGVDLFFYGEGPPTCCMRPAAGALKHL